VLLPTDTNLEERVLARTRAATTLYERHAYLVFNLALRIACDRAVAQRAAERAFLSLVSEEQPDAEVVRIAVRFALAEAPERPQPGRDGDPETTSLLAAAGGLAPAQRAALAVAGLCGLDARGVGAVLDLDEAGAATLLEASLAAFAARLATAPEAAAAAYGDWPWAPPPDELWQSVWPQLHAATEQSSRLGGGNLRALGGDSGAGGDGPPSSPAPPPRRRRRRVRLRLPRPRRRTVVLLVLLGAAGGAYASGMTPSFGGSASPPNRDHASAPVQAPGAAPAPDTTLPPAAPTDDVGDDAADVGPNPKAGAPPKPAEPLSPAELDKLRTQELSALKRYQRQEADPSLPAADRADASRRIARIERVARQRIAAAERRERAARRELARERAQNARERAARARERAADRERTRRAEQRAKEKEREAARTKAATPAPAADTEAEPQQDDGCLFNPDDGTYICPAE
jgi:hypothetical protein